MRRLVPLPLLLRVYPMYVLFFLIVTPSIILPRQKVLFSK